MAEIDTDELDSACEVLFGHTDWEFVEDKDTHVTIKFNVEDTREEEHNPETCDECIVARETGNMDKQGYEE